MIALYAEQLVEFKVVGQQRVYSLGPRVRTVKYRGERFLEIRTPDGCALTMSSSSSQPRQ
jgi:hypothetical protein